eukprot:6177682-Pleurochrysis_carterae.AAC.3
MQAVHVAEINDPADATTRATTHVTMHAITHAIAHATHTRIGKLAFGRDRTHARALRTVDHTRCCVLSRFACLSMLYAANHAAARAAAGPTRHQTEQRARARARIRAHAAAARPPL